MAREPSNVRRQDMTRTVKAVGAAGADIARLVHSGSDLPRESDFRSLPTRAPIAETELPCRQLAKTREREIIEFEHADIRYTAGASQFEHGGFAEIFLSAAKHGTAVDVNARDAAVAALLLLQHGCPVLRIARTRNSNGSASGPLARALDLLAEWR
jgi:hypothetical protein